jgi:hypothetical protein
MEKQVAAAVGHGGDEVAALVEYLKDIGISDK